MSSPTLFATSDLHVTHPGNREVVEAIAPDTDDDWLIVAGDIADDIGAIEETLALLGSRFAVVLWTPGNHDLWTVPSDANQLRGVRRYEALVDICRRLGIHSPEDEYPVWEDDDGTRVIAPLFLLYDYTFRDTAEPLDDALQRAYDAGLVFADEHLLHPEPFASRQEWCHHRVAVTESRLAAVPDDHRTVLASHYPLHRGPTRHLRHQHLAMWCGTELTGDWHVRFRADVVVYGHLHIPATLVYDGVRFEEVSLGYPREWRARNRPPTPLRRILPVNPTSPKPS